MTRVSVALATCNGEAFLAEQLESLAAQTLPPYEVVISDDASDDRTLEIARSWAGRLPLRIQANARRLGFRDNFLQAVNLCSGDVIALCDQDDVWLPRKLETCVERLERDDALLAMHALTTTDAQLQPIGAIERPDAVHKPLSLLAYPGGAYGLAMVFRRELRDLLDPRHRPPDPLRRSERMAHDTWYLLVASIFGKIATIAEPLVLYRQHGRNAYGAGLGRATSADRNPFDSAEAHATRARYCHEVADFLAAQHGPARAVAHYGKLARQYDARTELYGAPSAASRLAAFLRLAADGGYALTLRGRMGLPALAKDLSVGVTRVLART